MATPRLCSIPDCGKPHYGRDWCRKHYRRWHEHGDPLAFVRPMAPDGEPQRYYHEVVLTYEGDECLTWPYGCTSAGYGEINGVGYVHRLVCEHVNGPAPTPKHEAAHNCGKGHEGCAAKGHLSWKTRTENEADKFAHGTRARRKIPA